MKRVMIVGQPGAGKSTLARALGARTGLPVVHIDRIHWQSGWVMRDRAARLAMVREVELQPQWIFEGGLSEAYDHRLSRADVLIVLDLPLWLRSWRVLRRTLRHYGRSRPDLPENCPERFDPAFWRWIWDTRHSAAEANRALIGKAGPDVVVHHLRSPRAVRKFLAGLDAGTVSGQEARHGTGDDRQAGLSG